jgi:cytochrome b
MKEAKTVPAWDLAVRLGHWSLALLVLVAFLTSEEDGLAALHAYAGLAILGLVLFRVVWGFLGSPNARFAAFVRSPQEVLAYARDYVKGRPPRHLSHNPLGGVMVLALLGLLGAITATGILIKLGPEWGGPLAMSKSLAHGLEEVHEVTAGMLPVLIGLHVAGVILSSWLEEQNLIKGMITGKKLGEEPAALPLGRKILALSLAALVGAGTAIGLALVLPANTAEAAEPPAGLLDRYAGLARAEDATVAGFDAARGKRLYLEEHPKGSCATCHTDDPKRTGRSPAGKIIEPLAPSANARRFTDRVEADKWFDRNCKQVLGRVCTAAEKGDVLAWLLTI